MDRRQFLKGLGALAGWSVLRGATPAAAGLLRGPDGLRAYELVSLASVQASGAALDVLHEGFDLTEHGRDGWFDVVLWPGDRRRLDDLGYRYEILVEDLVAQDIADRTAEAVAQHQAPQERLLYRTLADYQSDLQSLAERNPTLVRHFTVGTTHEGRTLHGVEISKDISTARTDGRATSFMCGVHHAREWPSSEFAMMFAQDLVDEFTKGNAQAVSLLSAVRLIVIPVVNPDGFVRSRETISDFVYPTPIVVQEFAYHRKNMRKNTPSVVETGQGVDPNRNYPYYWGGDGSSGSTSSQTYRGPTPGSEPEIQAVLSLLRSNQVLTLITNHTYGNLVLRPWGHKSTNPPDEAHLKALGTAMAAINGYTSQKGIQLYKTNGTTEDWLYGAMGGFGYTYEHGTVFHPQYNLNILTMYNNNKGAFTLMVEAARNPVYHSILTGTFPPGSTVTLRKSVVFELDPATPTPEKTFADSMQSSIVVGPAGTFTWHVNPSPLPETVARVNAGGLPESALEPYTVEVRLPDGASLTKDMVVRRGQAYEVEFEEA